MTELKFANGDLEFKLSCDMNTDRHRTYIFKLEQREKGKRKWNNVKEQEKRYCFETDMDIILKYLSKEQVIEVAELEYKKYKPSNILF